MLNLAPRVRVLCFGLLLSALSLSPQAAAAAIATARVAEPVAVSSTLADLAAQNPDLGRFLDTLKAEAAAKGSVSVAVKLNVTFAPQVLLRESEKPLQRREIAAAAKALKDAMSRARSFQSFPDLPYAVLELDQADLTRLANRPGLARISRAGEMNWRRDFVELRSGIPGKPRANSSGLTTVRPAIGYGWTAAPDVHPFQVALLSKDYLDPRSALFCGGVLVAERFVLTAAHCSDFIEPASVQVLVGTQRLDGGGRRVDVSRIHLHPGYMSWVFPVDYDVAVWELAGPVNGIPFPTIASIAPTYNGTELRVTGWGQTVNGYNTIKPTELQGADVPFVRTTDGKCQEMGPISPRMICAGGTWADSCKGDSGGPLTRQVNRGDFSELVGLVSWGWPECGTYWKPGVYTNIAESSISSFIRDVVFPLDRKIGFVYTSTPAYESGTYWQSFTVKGRSFYVLSRNARVYVERGSTEGTASFSYGVLPKRAKPLPLPPPSPFSGKLATGEFDYVPVTGTITFGPGEGLAIIEVPIIDDKVEEGGEDFEVYLYGASEGWWVGSAGSLGGNPRTTVNIKD